MNLNAIYDLQVAKREKSPLSDLAPFIPAGVTDVHFHGFKAVMGENPGSVAGRLTAKRNGETVETVITLESVLCLKATPERVMAGAREAILEALRSLAA